ncbi:MAG: AsmA-like C-terminal domain-containing protein [Campylobacterota bacterium]|nr:AsmA-like C-terminal domain-containing protein [Campylobacterota bacterium]
MIKSTIIFSSHAIHVLIRNTLILLIILFVGLFYWLKAGIHVDNLTFGHYKIEGLYIKLNKKLTLKAHNIIIPTTKAKPSFNNIDQTFDNMKYLFTFFDYIELEKIHFENNKLNIFFADDILYVTSNDYEIVGNIHRKGAIYTSEISFLHIKKENIYLSGKLMYDAKRNRMETKGKFNAYHIKGRFKVNKEHDSIDFSLNSEVFTDLKTLIDKFPLSEEIKSWIVGKIQANEYKLHFLTGRGKIKDNAFKIDFDTLKGDVLYKEVKIFYKEGLSPVVTDNFILSYKNGGLDFTLKNPMYQDRNLSGSKVSIDHLLDEEPIILSLDLHIESVIDSVVQKILKAYNLTLPVRQEGSLAKVNVKLDIPLGETNQETSTFVNVDLAKGDLFINKVKLSVNKGNVQFDKGFIILNGIELQSDWYKGIVKGEIDLATKKAKLSLDAKYISIGEKRNKFFVLKNKNIPFTLHYSNRIKVDIPSLKLKIENYSKSLAIKVGKLKKIKPYLKNLGLQIDDGVLDIRTKDFKTYTFKGTLHRKSCVLYGRKDVCYTRVPCSGKATKNGISFYAFNKKLYYNSAKSQIKLKNLNIDLKKFLSVREKVKKSKVKNIVLIGKKSKLKYGKFRLLTDSYDIEVKANGNIKAYGSLNGDVVKFNKKRKNISVKALRVKDKMLHPFINFKGLKKGRYTLKMSGNPDKVLKGQIIVEGGIMSDFKAYNNTLAFINTLPALATLQNPGFSEKGFKIKEGVVEYTLRKNKIIFTSVYIKGGSATIVGKGEVDIKTKKIKMDLAIQTARELGKFVGSIPLLGYILMGKDKSMTVGLSVTGTLNNPKVKTSATQEILLMPLQLLKRTIELPAHILNR